MEFGWWDGLVALFGLGGGVGGGVGSHRYLQGRAEDRVDQKLTELLYEVKKVRRVAYHTQRRLDKVEVLLKVQSGGTAVDILGEESE